MKLNQHFSSGRLAMEYFQWLPTLMPGLLEVKKDESFSNIEISFLTIKLLCLKRLIKNSGVYFEVVGGILSKKEGFFSFIVEDEYLITSLKNFGPSLPWPIYRITQYPFHDLVMFLYSQYLLTLR